VKLIKAALLATFPIRAGTSAFAQISFSNQVLTTQAPPAAATSFLTTNNTVYVFFEATIARSDSLTSNWLAPDGTVVPGISWALNSGHFCFPGASLSIGNLPQASSVPGRPGCTITVSFSFRYDSPLIKSPAPMQSVPADRRSQ
jgi:hypothetical protein